MSDTLAIVIIVTLLVLIALSLVAGAWAERRQRRVDLKPTTHPDGLRTASGKLVTDEDFERLADEAEAGYDVEHLRRREP